MMESILGENAKAKPAKDFVPDENSKTTGWFKGADGKMRFEIDDSQAEIVPLAKINEERYKKQRQDFFRKKFPSRFGKVPTSRLEDELSTKELKELSKLETKYLESKNKRVFEL